MPTPYRHLMMCVALVPEEKETSAVNILNIIYLLMNINFINNNEY